MISEDQKTIIFTNDDDGKSVFLRKLYYEFVCEIITDFFKKPLEKNKFHDQFVSMLLNIEDYNDVYDITTEVGYYWALSIIHNEYTTESLSVEEIEKFSQFSADYYHKNEIISFVNKFSCAQ